MLKIKDDVDLKELEKFGFKPRYSDETRELVEYFCVNVEKGGFTEGIAIKEKKKPAKLRIRFTFKRNKLGLPLVRESKIWQIDNENYYYVAFDKLYDLIKADLVEKVED